MTPLEKLEQEAYEKNVEIIPFDLSGTRLKGLYCDSTIALRKDLPPAEKACILAEELGHHYTTCGNILEQSNSGNRK